MRNTEGHPNTEHEFLNNVEKEARLISETKFPTPEIFIERMEEMDLKEHARTYEAVVELFKIIESLGGKVLLVGGSVRDVLMGKVSKDFDVEIYGLSQDEVRENIEGIGKVSAVGKSFGILKVFVEGGLDIDIIISDHEVEKSEGEERDFTDSIIVGSSRRDFTMNSVAADVITGEIYDPFGGVKDIKERILRVTDEEDFRKDPIRILRGVQFIGRFGLTVDADTMNIMREMTPLLREAKKERIGVEWRKLLLKSEKPSLGLNAGMMFGVFEELHDEFAKLPETQQDAEWHPEGDVWIHTLMVVDEASKIVEREGLEGDDAFVVMLGALCHDLGKVEKTEFIDGHIRSRGHEQAGEEPTLKFLASIGVSALVRKKVVKLVINHLVPTTLYIESEIKGHTVKQGAISRLAKRLHPATIYDLTLVSESDHLGRGAFDEVTANDLVIPAKDFKPGEWLMRRARELRIELSKPADMTMGRDWIAFGINPKEKIDGRTHGFYIGKLIELSNQLRDDKGFSKEMVFIALNSLQDSQDPRDLIIRLEAYLHELD